MAHLTLPGRSDHHRRSVGLSELEGRVLAALPHNAGAGRWPTSRDVASRAQVTPQDARRVLGSLRVRYLVEDDGERPQAFARTTTGEVALEHEIDG